MELFLVKWKYGHNKAHYGYVQAKNEKDALDILINRTKESTYGHIVIKKVSLYDLTPFSICINFINPTRGSLGIKGEER